MQLVGSLTSWLQSCDSEKGGEGWGSVPNPKQAREGLI